MRKLMALLTAAIAMLLMSTGAAHAQTSGPVLDANVPDGDGWDTRFFSGQKKLAQTFVAQNSGRLTEVRFRVKPYSPNTTSLTAEIVTPPAAGNPARSLSKVAVPASSMDYQARDGGIVTASFVSSAAPPVNLVAGREYALRLTAPSPGAYWIERYSYPNTVYPAGKLCDASEDLAWNSCFNSDGVFAVYVLPDSTIDSTPPTITARTPSSPLTPGWNNTDFDVTLTASDNQGGSGVESITYSADGAQRLLPTIVSGDRASLRITQEGETTLTYSARDRAGNAGPDQTLTVRLDKTEPYTTLESGPDGPTNDTTPSFAFGGMDNMAPPEDLLYSYRLDDGGWSTYSEDTGITLGGEEGLQDGTHTLHVRSMDLAGNVDTTLVERAFVVDTSLPSASASTSPAPNEAGWHSGESIWINLSASDEVGIEGISVSASGAGAASVPSGILLDDSGRFPLWQEGVTQISYFAIDRAGNRGPEQTLTVRIDRTHPGGIITGPSGPANDSTPTFDFTGTDNLSASEDLLFSYRLDDGEWSAFSVETSATLGGEAGLADGPHSLYLRVMDLAGNVGGSFPQDFVVDTVAPDTKIFSGPSRFTRSRSAEFDVGTSERGDAECRLDGAEFGACPPSGTYTDLADGEHVFLVRAIDAAGNVDPTPARFRWTVDTVSPSGSFEIDGGDSMTRTRMVELALEARDHSPASGVSGVRIKNEGGEWSAWRPYESSASWRLTAGPGMKAVYVQYRDRVGNHSATARDTIFFNP